MRKLSDHKFMVDSPAQPVPSGQKVKGYSTGNGACVTVRKIGTGVIMQDTEQASGESSVKGKSSISNGACVTVARDYSGGVALWDSKRDNDPGGAPEWYFTANEWKEFINACHDGAISDSTLANNNGYNNIIVADDADVEIEIRDSNQYEWRFSRYPDIIHTYTHGEMVAFILAAYTEQISDNQWYTTV